MILPDYWLHDVVRSGVLGIAPFDPGLVQPASIDVRLGSAFRIFTHPRPFVPGPEPVIDPTRSEDYTEAVEVAEGGSFMLAPGAFILGSTMERFALPAHLAARLEGKSSLGRLGVVVHSTAGFIDPGFQGQITLELSNLAPLPVRLTPGMRIGQLCVMLMSGAAQRPYGTPGLGSRYQGQEGPTASRSHLAPETW